MLKLLFKIEYYIGYLLGFFNRSRLNFEKKNLFDVGSFSFKDEGKTAQLAVEFSSEGEFEQVRYFLEVLLQDSDFKVELIFCSPSVEKVVVNFFEKYRKQVRYLRLPIFYRSSQFTTKWITAKTFMMVRYDFFPQLLYMGKVLCDQFFLVSCSTKKLRQKNKFWHFIFKKIYGLFDIVVCVLKADRDFLVNKLKLDTKKVQIADFRLNQINKRIEQSTQCLENNFPWWDRFNQAILGSFPKESRIVLGSFWASEFEFIFSKNLKDDIQSKRILLSIVPHDLSKEHLTEIKNKLNKNGIRYYEYSTNLSSADVESFIGTFLEKPGVVILNLKGILCELYQYFDVAYVGGGHKDSVHSLLEPSLSNCKVLCGPKLNRSSEYDLIKMTNQDQLHIFKNSDEFYQLIATHTSFNNQLFTYVHSNQKVIENLKSYFHD
ncbi:MAG: hypothetical protein H6621_11745 [Halobacteriovoraceae bacterium]|nr:hypothetical protein [Halobacteriovoraceae bacterium]MCB9095733.1 hypothetical protein [Halobacteriovoraceae bacterium]